MNKKESLAMEDFIDKKPFMNFKENENFEEFLENNTKILKTNLVSIEKNNSIIDKIINNVKCVTIHFDCSSFEKIDIPHYDMDKKSLKDFIQQKLSYNYQLCTESDEKSLTIEFKEIINKGIKINKKLKSFDKKLQDIKYSIKYKYLDKIIEFYKKDINIFSCLIMLMNDKNIIINNVEILEKYTNGFDAESKEAIEVLLNQLKTNKEFKTANCLPNLKKHCGLILNQNLSAPQIQKVKDICLDFYETHNLKDESEIKYNTNFYLFGLKTGD